MLQFAASGYYGFGNAGDEAVLAGIKAGLDRRSEGRVRLLAFAHEPNATTALHQIPAVDRMNLAAMRQALLQSDLLLSGGGSLLQDTTSFASLLYYLWVARLAYSHKTPIMFYAQGLGPLRRAMSRTLVRIVGNHAAYITVRDEPSRQLLARIGVTRPPIEVTADPAFALPPASDAELQALLAAENLSLDAPLIGVALRPWHGDGPKPLTEYARLLTELERQCGAKVVLLPMQVPGDVIFAEQVAACAERDFPIVRHAYHPSVLLALVARMQAVVAMRLHALIFAARVGVPLYALSYDPKVLNLMQRLNLSESAVRYNDFAAETAAAHVAGLLAEREARVAALQALQPDLEARALRNAECALSLF